MLDERIKNSSFLPLQPIINTGATSLLPVFCPFYKSSNHSGGHPVLQHSLLTPTLVRHCLPGQLITLESQVCHLSAAGILSVMAAVGWMQTFLFQDKCKILK